MSQTQIDEIRELVSECLQTPVEDLIDHDDWGSISFDVARPHLNGVFGMLRPLESYPLEVLPDPQLEAMKNGIGPIRETMDQIRSFSLENGSPKEVRDQLSAQLKANLDAAYQSVGVYLPYLAYQHGDIQRNLDQLASMIADAKEIIDDGTNELKAKKEEMEGILSAAREAAAEVGVAHFTKVFSTEAGDNDKSAGGWLKFTALAAGITLVTSVAFLYWTLPDTATTLQSIQHSASKLILLGILISVSTWSGGQYRTARHNQALNKHRANSLLTFQAFSQAASDGQTKDAVLLEATRAIFGLASTGYTKEQSGGSGGVTQVLELIRSETGKTGSDG